ncbi:MAG: D-apionate lactonase, partial [Geminicoccaceae bacterium]
MITAPSRAVALFGTEESVAAAKTLRAGPLTVEFDNGALRYIKVGGKEAIRNIAFVVRDKDWGTYNPVLENLKIGQASNAFEVSFDAICKDANQELHYSAKIKGSSDGTLTFEGVGKAVTDFLTNRTGFVVLHPVDGVAGCPVEVLRVDGSREQTSFPEYIDPMCPFQDLRALTHEVLPGIKVTCRMEGDTFETEDHRNWNDASFKTYVRPLALPWPYAIKAGETTEQSVTLSLAGEAPVVKIGGGIQPVTLRLGAEAGTMPAIGLSLPPEQDKAILGAMPAMKQLAPQFFICPFDSRIADGAPKRLTGPRVSTFPLDDPRLDGRGEVMGMFKALGEATGAELVLEAVLACQDETGAPSADQEIMRRDLNLIRQAADDAGVTFAKVAVSPASDLKCTLPGSVWPPCPLAADIYQATRDAFPGLPLGGGMFSFFTELNRKRPPVE